MPIINGKLFTGDVHNIAMRPGNILIVQLPSGIKLRIESTFERNVGNCKSSVSIQETGEMLYDDGPENIKGLPETEHSEADIPY